MNTFIKQINRKTVLCGTLVAALSVLAIMNYMDLKQSRIAAVSATEDLEVSRRLIRQIHALNDQPVRAGTQEVQLQELISRIEQAAQEAQVPPDSLVRIWPEPARRIGDTPYQQKPTQILLRKVTLKHIVQFIHALTTGDLGLNAQAVRLTSPRGDESSNTWTVEVTLTYHIYAPRDRKSAI